MARCLDVADTSYVANVVVAALGPCFLDSLTVATC